MADTELLPCPFCGGAARIESNRDWHRIYAAHDDECVFDADDHALMYPAQPGYLIQIAEKWNRRASPPSPSTAPESSQFANRENGEAYNSRLTSEVDERAAFEAWHHSHFGVHVHRAQAHHGGDKRGLEYWSDYTNNSWAAWQARAVLASRPAEVDDEGLPPLPAASARAYVQNGYRRASVLSGPGEPLFTAEQYRQGQRDAVAAYRAAKEFCDKNCLSYRREPGCSMGKLCVSEP